MGQMPFSEAPFDAATKAAATLALEDACQQLRGGEETDRATLMMVKLRILAALVEGERDPEKLRELAIQALT
jgi:hypothetical protein